MNATKYSMGRMYILCMRPGEVDRRCLVIWSTNVHIQTYTHTATTTILDHNMVPYNSSNPPIIVEIQCFYSV